MNESHHADLVRRCQAGDKEAFRALIEVHQGVLFGTAYLMTRDRGQAEDAVQEALIRIWKSLPRFRFQSTIKAWLVRIVINEVKQQFRKKKIRMVPFEETIKEMGQLDETESALIRSEERWILRKALDKLPAEQREAVTLRYFSDLTIPEIAAVMNKREGTIKSRLSRALDRLGKILREDETWGERGESI